MAPRKKLRIGDWVEVRTKEEILKTLDSNGCVDAMPFMPEMLAFCGQRFRVFKIAHKTCDYTTKYFHSGNSLGRFISKRVAMVKRTGPARLDASSIGKRIG